MVQILRSGPAFLGSNKTNDNSLQFYDYPINLSRLISSEDTTVIPATNVQSSSKATKKPSHVVYFILHAGPPKTGTTSIQCTLRELQPWLIQARNLAVIETQDCRPKQSRKELTERYNLTFTKGGIGTYDNIKLGATFLPNCWRHWQPQPPAKAKNANKDSVDRGGGMPDCWNESYLRVIREEYQQGRRSTIVSNEGIPSGLTRKMMNHKAEFLNNLIESLDSVMAEDEDEDEDDSLPGGEVRLVVILTYRRWYEWSMSRRHEFYNVLEGEKPKPKLKQWPEKGGMHVPTPLEFIQSGQRQQDYIDRAILFFADHPRVDLRIINFHDGNDVVKAFLCTALPIATQLHGGDDIGPHGNYVPCNTTTEDGSVNTGPPDTPRTSATVTTEVTEQQKKMNARPKIGFFWADRLAIAAHERGLIPKDATRRKATSTIYNFVNDDEFFHGLLLQTSMICPTQKDYNKILERSLQLERVVTPYLFRASSTSSSSISTAMIELETQHRTAFDNAIQEKKLCVVNTTAMLEDENWRSMLARIFT